MGKEGRKLAGNATVGRNLTLTATAGNIVQQPATALRADWADGVERSALGVPR